MEEKRLEELMKARGTNTRRLAMSAGLSYSTLYDVVIGKRTLNDVSAGKVQAIADALGVSFDELMGNVPPTLTADEAELLGLFRSLPPFGRKMALATVRNIAEGLRDE